MYMAIRKYQMTPGASVQDIVRRVQVGFVPVISQTPGFVAYHILDTGSGTITSVSLFQDQAGADESTRRASEWVSQNLASLLLLPAQLTAGEVVYSTAS
jgi:predicted solute-binding protein